MLQAHVEAGLDPQHFWTLTPREWLVLMRGAHDRREAARITAAVTSWLGTHLDGKGLDAWIASARREAAGPIPPEVVDRMLALSSVGLPMMTLDEYRSMKGAR